MNELINEYRRYDSPDDKATCGPAALVIPRCSVNSELSSKVEQQEISPGKRAPGGWALRSVVNGGMVT
jgi:hypothetical protein